MVSVLIIGVGQYGSHIAKRMEELGCEVMAIDINEERINDILPFVTSAQIGDSTDDDFLKSLGVSNYDVCIVSIGDNFQNSLETTALLKELGAKKVIARASNDVQMKFLLRNGADEVAYPEKQSAMRIATKYASESILDFLELDDKYSIYEMKVPSEWDGESISDLDIRKKYNVNIIAIKSGDKVEVPFHNTIMRSGDIVLAIGDIEEIQKCFKVK